MRRTLLLLLTSFSIIFAPVIAVSTVAAVNVLPSCGAGSAGGTPGVCTDANSGTGSTTNPVVGLIATTIEVLSIVIGIAAAIGIVLSGIKFIISNGDSNGVASARSSLIYSLAGVAIAVVAQLLVKIVVNVTK